MGKTADPGYRSLQTESEACMGNTAVATQICEPGEVSWIQLMVMNSGFEDIEIVLSLTAADDRLIVLTGTGALMTAPATPKGFKPSGRTRVLDKDCWTAPVLANGLLYCRNSKGHLVCLDLRRGQ